MKRLIQRLRNNALHFLGTTTPKEFRIVILGSEDGKLYQVVSDGTAVFLYKTISDLSFDEVAIEADEFIEKSKGAEEMLIHGDRLTLLKDGEARDVLYVQSNLSGGLLVPPTNVSEFRYMYDAAKIKQAYRFVAYQPNLVDEGVVYIWCENNNLIIQAEDRLSVARAETDIFCDTNFKVAVPYRSFAHLEKTLPLDSHLGFIKKGMYMLFFARRHDEEFWYLLPAMKPEWSDIPSCQGMYHNLTPAKPVIVEALKVANEIFDHPIVFVTSDNVTVKQEFVSFGRENNARFQISITPRLPDGLIWIFRWSAKIANIVRKLNPLYYCAVNGGFMLFDGYGKYFYWKERM